MKYSLDVLDRANVYGIGTVFENNPSFRFFLDEKINVDKLKKALIQAFQAIPYMKSRLTYDTLYYLEDNPAEFPIFHCRFEDRCLWFGKETNGYMFQLTYNDNELMFDWSHVPVDGLGMLSFMRAVLGEYFGLSVEYDPDIYEKLPIENHYDSSADYTFMKAQADGFDQDRISHFSPHGSAHCTILSVPAQQILTFRERVDATPAAIVSALIAKTFRLHLQQSDNVSENNNVKGKIVVTTRKPLGVTTLHNCYQNLFVTYTDAFDKLDFSTVCTVFRTYIDLSVQTESVLNNIKIQKETLTEMEGSCDQASVWKNAKKQAIEKRKSLCSFNFSYLGILPFEKEIMRHVKDFQAICLNENSEFGVFAYSYNDRLYLSVCENYEDNDMVSEFVDLCSQYGITFEKTNDFLYHQAYFHFPEGLSQSGGISK